MPVATMLDAHQRAAVDHRNGPCLVLAGPGSGKTRVIVERLLALIEDGVGSAHQLVLTYTGKAAEEMRHRAEAAHGPFDGDPPLSTFHAFARRLLRDWGALVGVPPHYRLADHAERWMLTERVLADLRPAGLWNPLRPHDMIDQLTRLFNTAKQELVTPDNYVEWSRRALGAAQGTGESIALRRHRECAAVYAELDRRSRAQGILDHDDCILLAHRLLQEQPKVRQEVADLISHVMVDEYQDTNYAQARLVETLVAGHRNVMVVADDDQAIYKFRGASLANLDRFARTYPEHRRITLDRNYRSTPAIVAISAALTAAASPGSRIPKQLYAVRQEGTSVEVWEAEDERSEVDAVAAACADWAASGTDLGGVGWLFRRHADMEPAVAALQRAGIGYRIHGGRGFFQHPVIKDVLALLAATQDPGDAQSILRCLRLPRWQLRGSARVALVDSLARGSRSVADAVLAPDCGVDGDDAQRVRDCLAVLADLHDQSTHADVRELFQVAVEQSGLLHVRDAPTNALVISHLADILEGFADWCDDRHLAVALQYLGVLRDSGSADQMPHLDDQPAANAVTLLTAHAAKGLEWPIVIVSSCVDTRWPTRGGAGPRLSLPDDLVPEPPPSGDGPLDEERRLFYVALTRARDRLILTHALRYPGAYREVGISPFIGELSASVEPPRRVTLPTVVSSQPRRKTLARQRPDDVRFGVTDLATFRRCPRKFAYRHHYRIPPHTGIAGHFGTAIHSVLETAGERRRHGDEVGADELEALWRQAWARGDSPLGADSELLDYGADRLRRYAATPAWRNAAIASVESNFVMRTPLGLVTGRFDRVDRPPDGPLTIVDYKTGSARPPEAVGRDLQVRAYAAALSQADGRDSIAVELHYLHDTEAIRVTLDAAELERAYRFASATLADVLTAVQRGAFPPRPSRWLCPRCEYRTVCDEGRDSRAEAARSTP